MGVLEDFFEAEVEAEARSLLKANLFDKWVAAGDIPADKEPEMVDATLIAVAAILKMVMAKQPAAPGAGA
jgi:hypothetical protein